MWSIHATTTKPTGETPFFLIYGAEVVMPIEIKHGSPRVLPFNDMAQEELLQDDLTVLDETHHKFNVWVARYKQEFPSYHCCNICMRTLEVGDLVLRWVLSHVGLHKLSPMWDDPFRVMHVVKPGVVRLE